MTTPKSRVDEKITAARREAMRRMAGRALTAARADLAEPGHRDILLGSHGSKWRHGWIPLNPIAAAIKAKKFKSHGGVEPKAGELRRVSKTRVEVPTAPSLGKARPKGRAPAGRSKAPVSEVAEADFRSREGRQRANAQAGRVQRGESYTRPHPGTKAGRAYTGYHESAKSRGLSDEQAHRFAMSSMAADEQTRRPSAPSNEAEQYAASKSTDELRDRLADPRGLTPRVLRAMQAEFNRRGAPAPKKSVLSRTEQVGDKAENFWSDTYKSAMKSGDLDKLERSAKALHGQGYDLHADTGEWHKADTADENRPWVMIAHRGQFGGGKGKDRIIVRRRGSDPQAKADEFGVEINGQHIGTMKPGDKGGIKISASNLPEHEVPSLKHAVAGLHAAHTLRRNEADAKKAAADAARQRQVDDYKASQLAAQAEAEKQRREQDRADTIREAAKAEANRRKLLTPAKAPSTKPSKDSAAKEKARAALQEQLSREAVDAHSVDPRELKPGQAVKFNVFTRGEATQHLTGHVAHAGGGVVHVHTDTGTYSAHYNVSRGRAHLQDFTRIDPEAHRGILQPPPAVSRTTTNPPARFKDARGGEQRSYRDVVRIADEEFKKRQAVKAGKVPGEVEPDFNWPSDGKPTPARMKGRELRNDALAASRGAQDATNLALRSKTKLDHKRAAEAHARAAAKLKKIPGYNDTRQSHLDSERFHRAKL